MYVIDGIVYAGEPSPILRVIYAVYRGDHVIRVAFNTGEVVDVDFADDAFERLLDAPMFQPIKDKEVLKRFTIHDGVLTWSDGEIDLSSESLLRYGRTVNDAGEG